MFSGDAAALPAILTWHYRSLQGETSQHPLLEGSDSKCRACRHIGVLNLCGPRGMYVISLLDLH